MLGWDGSSDLGPDMQSVTWTDGQQDQMAYNMTEGNLLLNRENHNTEVKGAASVTGKAQDADQSRMFPIVHNEVGKFCV